jgi:CTP-dependent riboflavin kinase
MSQGVALSGRLCSGLGEGAGFTGLDWVMREFRQKLGYQPYPGTVNLSLAGETWQQTRSWLQSAKGIVIDSPPGFCAAKCFEVLINECIRGAAVLPDVADYPVDKLEIVTPVALRQELDLRDGDIVSFYVQVV